MRTKIFVAILVLLTLALPALPAHAGGVVTVCDEAHLLSALADGGTVTFACSGKNTPAAKITVTANTTIDGSGQEVAISGNNAVRVFYLNSGAALKVSCNELSIASGYCGARTAAFVISPAMPSRPTLG